MSEVFFVLGTLTWQGKFVYLKSATFIQIEIERLIQNFYSYELKSLEIVCNPVPIIENYIATNIQTKRYKIYFGDERSFFERRHNSVKFDGAFG